MFFTPSVGPSVSEERSRLLPPTRSGIPWIRSQSWGMQRKIWSVSSIGSVPIFSYVLSFLCSNYINCQIQTSLVWTKCTIIQINQDHHWKKQGVAWQRYFAWYLLVWSQHRLGYHLCWFIWGLENKEEEKETEADSNVTHIGPVYKQIRKSSEKEWRN